MNTKRRNERMAFVVSIITVFLLLPTQVPANEPDSYIIEKTKEMKRTRTYSVDDKQLAEEHEQFVKADGRLGVPTNGTAQMGRSSPGTQLAEAEDGNSEHRERRPSKLSFKGEEKKPFDRAVSDFILGVASAVFWNGQLFLYV